MPRSKGIATRRLSVPRFGPRRAPVNRMPRSKGIATVLGLDGCVGLVGGREPDAPLEGDCDRGAGGAGGAHRFLMPVNRMPRSKGIATGGRGARCTVGLLSVNRMPRSKGIATASASCWVARASVPREPDAPLEGDCDRPSRAVRPRSSSRAVNRMPRSKGIATRTWPPAAPASDQSRVRHRLWCARPARRPGGANCVSDPLGGQRLSG